ncbi:hypothetical protein BDW69DRAFT_160365 [Aspergillus filifer]
MDIEKWPNIVEPLLERLEYIIYNVFPMPQIPPEPSSALQYQQQYLNPTSSFLHDPNPVPSSSNKENAVPDPQASPPPASSLGPSSSTERIPESLPASQADAVPPSLPAPLILILQSIQSTLRSLFTSKPPHTVQRLIELILHPNAHYKTLPAYLRAVDRVVSVTSSADVFPFPMQSGTAQPQPNGTLNGAETTFMMSDNALGSDESLGGALLTPIPWLNNASSPGAEAAGIDEMSMDSTAPALQNQLLTQPADLSAQQTVGIDTSGTGSILEGEMTAEPEGIPHARGPSLLGVEDMGLQDGKGVEMTLLNKEAESDAANPLTEDSTTTTSQKTAASADITDTATTVTDLAAVTTEKDGTTDADADGDGDITLSDEPTIPQAQGASGEGGGEGENK